jgi:HD-GYP domain-containing protein (c-di-GMP phosphodiesterase class II)/uncharacterized protein YbbK (DUF523 family)
MLFISSDNLKPGMLLAMDLNIYNKYNFKTMLLRNGLPLTQNYINKILSNNISGVYIKSEAVGGNFLKNSVNEEFEANTLSAVKDIFYKYKLDSYKLSQRLIWQIFDLADDLIEEIIFNKTLLYKMLEYKSGEDYLYQHCINTAILSISLGDSLKLSNHMLRELAAAALLHDIGMLQVPDEILNKHDNLDNEEFRIVKMHPISAMKELKHFVSNDVLRGIASHHEHIDGTGYPYGLKGNQIHLFGKILSICDVYQALSSDFSFRRAWKPFQILNHIKEQINSKFDEEITETFIKELAKRVYDYEYIVSACLCGEKTRYDGKAFISDKIKKLVDEGKAIMVCPEVSGGLSTPRLPCEIKNGRVINIASDDKTDYFVDGAINVLETARKYGIKKAILKEKSPSCGSKFIYDGTFTKTLIQGEGITTRLLRLNNIEVISDEDY